MKNDLRFLALNLVLFLTVVGYSFADLYSNNENGQMYRRRPSNREYCPNSLINFASCATVRCASCDERSCSKTQKCCAVKQCCPVCTEALTRRPPRQKLGSCPVLQHGALGSCAISCQNDIDCSGQKKCCYTGCGQLCVDPETDKRGPGSGNYGLLA